MLISIVCALASDPAPLPGDAVRVGVFGLFRPQELEVRPLPGEVLVAEVGEREMTVEGTQRLTLHISGEEVWCATRDVSVLGTSVHSRSRSSGAVDLLLGIPGKIERRFLGSLEIKAAGSVLTPVITMSLETAVSSAAAAELPADAPLEALKAQAVVARSYYQAAPRRHAGFDFCDTTHCQFLRVPPSPDARAAIAARETRGLVLAFQARTLPALYSASCGGRTRNLAEAGMQPDGYPYFAVECHPCRLHSRTWEYPLEAADAAALQDTAHSESARLKIVRKIGWGAIPGGNYALLFDRERAIVRGKGAGHGLGLCQEGAAAMAAHGAGFREILSYYFPNTTLISRGQ